MDGRIYQSERHRDSQLPRQRERKCSRWCAECKLPPNIQKVARRKLRQLDAAEKPDDLRVPRGNRFEELKGDRKGTYSVRINDQWRITFDWLDGAPANVCIDDYHR